MNIDLKINILRFRQFNRMRPLDKFSYQVDSLISSIHLIFQLLNVDKRHDLNSISQ